MIVFNPYARLNAEVFGPLTRHWWIIVAVLGADLAIIWLLCNATRIRRTRRIACTWYATLGIMGRVTNQERDHG